MLTLTSLQHAGGRAIPLKIDRHHIKISIKSQLATTKVDQTFVNPNDLEVNGMYIFPVQDDAVISKLALSIDGKLVSGELLSQEQSYRIYRDSARYGDNKAILEHLGTRTFVVRVPGIPASGERRIQFEYSQVISADSDLMKYIYPLSLVKSASEPIGNLHVEMEIESEDELRTVYSPSHEVTIDRKDDHHVRVSYEGTDVDPDDDFLCYYAVSDDNFGITLLTHRADEKEDGYFMILVSPKYEVKQTEIIEKDFIFVLDRSGSMSGRKVEQAKAALRYCVQNLNDGDRFNLIVFNQDITSLADRLNRGEEWFGGERWPDATVLSNQLIGVKDGWEKAFAFIDGIDGRGMTNINDALLTALAENPDPNRPRIIVFLTDGQPTIGVRKPAQILENVAKANRNLSRIFVFGVGYDVNVRLLDKMAADNGGTRNDFIKRVRRRSIGHFRSFSPGGNGTPTLSQHVSSKASKAFTQWVYVYDETKALKTGKSQWGLHFFRNFSQLGETYSATVDPRCFGMYTSGRLLQKNSPCFRRVDGSHIVLSKLAM